MENPNVENTILLVDDEQDVLMMVSFYLQKAGYKVILAESGREALEKIKHEMPDLAIIDRMLPEMDGIELCSRLREKHPNLFLIMLTALGSDTDRIKGLETGVDDYIVKPFNPKELVLRVQAILRRRPTRFDDVKTVPASAWPVKAVPTEVVNSQTAVAAQNGAAASNGLVATTPASPLRPSNGNGNGNGTGPLEEGNFNAPAPANNGVQGTISKNMDSILKAASQAAQSRDYVRARELYLYALNLDRNCENALLWLAWNTNDPYEGCTYLERLVEKHPENTKLQEFLEAGRKRCQDLDNLISGSSVLSYWNIAEQVHQDRMRNNIDRRMLPITPIGQILIKRGIISAAQLETAVSLHEMFSRLGTPKKLGEVLMEYGYLSRDQLQQVLNEQKSDFDSQFY